MFVVFSLECFEQSRHNHQNHWERENRPSPQLTFTSERFTSMWTEQTKNFHCHRHGGQLLAQQQNVLKPQWMKDEKKFLTSFTLHFVTNPTTNWFIYITVHVFIEQMLLSTLNVTILMDCCPPLFAKMFTIKPSFIFQTTMRETM